MRDKQNQKYIQVFTTIWNHIIDQVILENWLDHISYSYYIILDIKEFYLKNKSLINTKNPDFQYIW